MDPIEEGVLSAGSMLSSKADMPNEGNSSFIGDLKGILDDISAQDNELSSSST
jgi:hypothetical protein